MSWWKKAKQAVGIEAQDNPEIADQYEYAKALDKDKPLQGFIRKMVESVCTVDPTVDRQFLADLPGTLVAFEHNFIKFTVELMEKHAKPVLGVSLLPDESARTVTEIEGSPYKGVSFLTPERAVKALARMNAYRQWRDQE